MKSTAVHSERFIRAPPSTANAQRVFAMENASGVWTSVTHVYSAKLILRIKSNLFIDIKVIQTEPALEPPAAPGRGGGAHDPQGPHVTAGQFFYRPYSITSHTCTILFSARCNQSLA